MDKGECFQLCSVLENFHSKAAWRDSILKWFWNDSCFPPEGTVQRERARLAANLFLLLTPGCQACRQGLYFFEAVTALLHHFLDPRALSSPTAKAGPLCLSSKGKKEAGVTAPKVQAPRRWAWLVCILSGELNHCAHATSKAWKDLGRGGVVSTPENTPGGHLSRGIWNLPVNRKPLAGRGGFAHLWIPETKYGTRHELSVHAFLNHTFHFFYPWKTSLSSSCRSTTRQQMQ